MHICRYMTYHQAYVFTHVEKFCWKLWLILTRTFLTIFHKASILCFLLKLLRDFFWWWWRNCQKEFCSEEFVMWKFSPFYASKGSKSIFESSKTQALLQVRKAFNALTATQTHNSAFRRHYPLGLTHSGTKLREKDKKRINPGEIRTCAPLAREEDLLEL